MSEIPPAGVSAASFFTPVEFSDPAKPPAILADKLDTSNGEFASLLGGRDPIDAAIAYHFRVERGSGASVTDVGQRFADIKKNDESAAASIKYEIERVLKPFVDRQLVRTVRLSVEADPDTDYGAAYVEYINLMTTQRRRQFVNGTNTGISQTEESQ